MISNSEIWNENRSPDDSRHFVENFHVLQIEKNKTGQTKKSDKKKYLSKKPNHLSVYIFI